MIWIASYLIIGLLNLAHAAGQGNLMIFDRPGKHAEGLRLDGMVEVAFYVLLWPLQVLFWTFVGIHMATDWALGKFMG